MIRSHYITAVLAFLLVSTAYADAPAPAAPAVAAAPAAPAAPAVAAVAAAPAAPAVAAAPAAPAVELSPEEVVALGKLVMEAAKGGNWGLALAGILMLLVWVLRKFVIKTLSPAAMPWVAAIAGVVGAVAANVQAGESWSTAVMSGLMTGAAASGLYSLVGKKLLGTASTPAAPEESAEEEEEEEEVAEKPKSKGKSKSKNA